MLKDHPGGGDGDGDGSTTTSPGGSTAPASTSDPSATRTSAPVNLQAPSKKISSGDIAGIVLASITLLILLGGVVLYLRRNRQKKERNNVDLLAGNASGMTEVSNGQGKPFVSGLLSGGPVSVNGSKQLEAGEGSTLEHGHSQKMDMSNISSTESSAPSINNGSGEKFLNSPGTGTSPTSPVSSPGPSTVSSYGYYGQGTREPITTPPPTRNADSKVDVPLATVLDSARDLRRELRNARESRYISVDEFPGLQLGGGSPIQTPTSILSSGTLPGATMHSAGESNTSLPPPYPT